MGENSKEEFDFKYDKIHRHRKVNGTKQNVIVRFRLHQHPSDLYKAWKKIKNRNIRLKPPLKKKRTELLRNWTERNTNKAYSSFTLISMEKLKLD